VWLNRRSWPVASSPIWPRPSGESTTSAGTPGAAYLKYLAMARLLARRGLSRTLVATCADLARSHGLGALRLDRWADNETLEALYRDQGFREAAELTREGHLNCLFEETLRDGSPT
jgi:ribosomal protein S18 acetylase RimI-like enzyme